MIISYKFRMYSGSKDHRLHRLVTTAGRIWNHCVAFQRTHFRLFGKYCNKNVLMKHIARVRNRRDEWKTVCAQSVQELIFRLDLAYQAFFKWLKARSGTKCGKPKFRKSSGAGSVTFQTNGNGWAYVGGDELRIGKHQYRFIKTREIEGKIKQCIIKRDNLDRFWVFLVCEKEDVICQTTGSTNTAGFDFGLRKFLTCSDGTSIESPQFLKAEIAKIARLTREYGSKERGSGNQRRAKVRLARLHERIARRRRDWFLKLAHSLCDRFDVMYFESIETGEMRRKWGRKVDDLSFYNFIESLRWVAHKRGKRVVQIGRWEPTTKTCHRCGRVQDMSLDVRVFDCGGCGHSCDRDLNAALNIKRLGHQADGLGDVSLASQAVSV